MGTDGEAHARFSQRWRVVAVGSDDCSFVVIAQNREIPGSAADLFKHLAGCGPFTK